MKHLSRTALCGVTFLLLAGTAMANPPGTETGLLSSGAATAAGVAVSSPVNVNPGPAEIPTGEFQTNMPSLSGPGPTGPAAADIGTPGPAVEIAGATPVAADAGLAVVSSPINLNPGPVDIPTGEFHTNMPELSGGPTPPVVDVPVPTGPAASTPGSVGGIGPGGI